MWGEKHLSYGQQCKMDGHFLIILPKGLFLTSMTHVSSLVVAKCVTKLETTEILWFPLKIGSKIILLSPHGSIRHLPPIVNESPLIPSNVQLHDFCHAHVIKPGIKLTFSIYLEVFVIECCISLYDWEPENIPISKSADMPADRDIDLLISL